MNDTGGRTAAPGWYPDPSGGGGHRWWDGNVWTADTRPPGTPVVSDPSSPLPVDKPVADRRMMARKLGPLRLWVWILIACGILILLAIGAGASDKRTEKVASSASSSNETTEGPTTTATTGPPTTTTTVPPPTTAAPSTTASPRPSTLFPGRVDAQKEDQERNIGEGAMLSGYTATVTSAAFQPSLSSFETDGYVIIDVTILNRDKKAQPYNLFDWRLQTPSGSVINPTFTSVGALSSADLVSGGTVTGKVVFEVGAETGDFYIIYKPDPLDAARGIWKVTV
jgi:Domain of unknown function (DUF4352)/Protein of unknown function (DUF2510)